MIKLDLAALLDQLGDERAACADVDPELFWPRYADDPRIDQAKQICQRCPIRDACLEWAVRNENDGIWGGKTPEERGPLRWRWYEQRRRVSPWNRAWKRTA